MRSSRLAVLRWPAAVYIDIFRATPILVQLVWIYDAMPIVLGVQMGNMVAASVGIGLHAAAYVAEIFRAGIESIDRGQSDAAKSLGMGYGQAMRRIILPQAVRRMVPPFINEFATLMKLTTLGSVIAVLEAAARGGEPDQQHLSAARGLHGGGGGVRPGDLSFHLAVAAARATLEETRMTDRP